MLKQSAKLELKEASYKLEIQSDLTNELKVKLKHIETQQEYSNSFSKEFLEQLTQKTGNYKKFSIFVEMLCQCMSGHNCLTFDFAEIQEKHYLILCYSIQFDRVYYPLPMQKVKDIHKQVQILRHQNEEISRENKELKAKLEDVKNGLLEGVPIDSLLVILSKLSQS
jgi:predicted nuclease of restriction endonuclease-like RecB superfamily